MIKEGRCPNCGSILQLDASAEKGHCLFCDAVFQNKAAFDIAANPGGVTFPNLPQPKYSGPSLEPAQMAVGAGQRQKQGQPPVKKERKEPLPVYVPKVATKLPDMKMSPKARRMTLLVALAFLVVSAAIAVPVVISRETTKAAIIGQMNAIAPFTVDASKAVSLSRTDNSYLVIAASGSVSQEEMIELFSNFCLKRASLLKLNPDDFNKVYKAVTVKLVTPTGGYLIANPASRSALEDGSAIKQLP
jgi:hypothetical protein